MVKIICPKCGEVDEIIKQDTVETEQEKQKERIEGELDYLDGVWIY